MIDTTYTQFEDSITQIIYIPQLGTEEPNHGITGIKQRHIIKTRNPRQNRKGIKSHFFVPYLLGITPQNTRNHPDYENTKRELNAVTQRRNSCVGLARDI
jgi:hypothetical protein